MLYNFHKNNSSKTVSLKSNFLFSPETFVELSFIFIENHWYHLLECISPYAARNNLVTPLLIISISNLIKQVHHLIHHILCTFTTLALYPRYSKSNPATHLDKTVISMQA